MLDFSRIVALRQRRLDRMVKMENAEKAAVEDAKRALEAAQNAIDAYLEETRTLEIDLLSGLLGKKVSVNDLLAVEEELKNAKKKAKELADRRAECNIQLTEANERARVAARNRVQSARKLNKSEHIQTHMESLLRQAEMVKEEAAIDEFCEQLAVRGIREGSDDA